MTDLSSPSASAVRTMEDVIADALELFPGAVVTERRSVGLEDLVRFEESKHPQPAQRSLFGSDNPKPRPQRGRPGRGGRRRGR